MADSCGSKILYLSTVHVFDGKNPPYLVDSKPNSLNSYGKIKLAGEEILMASDRKHIILRVPILYGPVEYLGESAVTLIAEKLMAQEKSSHDNDAIRYPTNTEDVAFVISELLKLEENDQTIKGIYHWSSDHGYTKYEIASIMANILNIPQSNIFEADPNPLAAPRPHNSQLDNSRIKSLNIIRESDFRTSLESILHSSMEK